MTTTDDSAEFSLLGHKPALFVLFFTEMWERFSYYGMRAIFVLFLTSSFADGGEKYPEIKTNQKALNELLNLITEDLTKNYDSLTTNNKIRILHSFARKYDNDSIIQLDNLRFEFMGISYVLGLFKRNPNAGIPRLNCEWLLLFQKKIKAEV